MKKFNLHLVVYSLLAISCSSPEKKQTDHRTVFKYNEMAGISSLDPAAARNFENIWAVNQLFNGLVQMDDSLIVQPCIAKAWEISTDGLVYTFHLRTDVCFHDCPLFPDSKGRKVTAEDFSHSFFRLFDAKVSSAASLISNIDRSSKSGNRGFVAPNDSTFLIYLQKPFTPFLGILTMKYFSVIPHEIVEHYGEDFRSHPIGTGPFKLKMWEEGSRLIFVKNENYFEKEGDAQLPYLDAVSISFIKDKETAFLEFLKNNLDMVSGVDALNKEEVLTKNGDLNPKYADKFLLQSQPFLKTDYLGFLVDEKIDIVKDSPFKVKEVRQAINYGFDRNKMVKFLRGNLGNPASAGFVPPGLPSFLTYKIKGYGYDPDKARALLAQGGYPGGIGLPSIVLHTTEQYLDLCEFIQSQLSEVGIVIKINVDKAAVLSEAVASSELNFFRKSWIGDYPDAENFLSLFYSKNFSPIGFNYTHFKNDKYDALFEKAQAELNDTLRYSYYSQMDQIIMEEAPIVPIYYDQMVRLIQKSISGLSPNPMNLLNLKKVKKSNS